MKANQCHKCLSNLECCLGLEDSALVTSTNLLCCVHLVFILAHRFLSCSCTMLLTLGKQVIGLNVGNEILRQFHQLRGPSCTRKAGMILTIAAVVSFVAPDHAKAQSASFRSVDTNGDRVLDFDELVAAFGRAGATRILSTTDRNGDGRITIFELRADPGDGRSSTDDRSEEGDDNDDDDNDGDDRGDDDGEDGDDGGDDD